MASLQIIDGDRRVFRYDIGPNAVTFGRGAGGQFLVSDGKVTPHAYRIVGAASGFTLQNLDADGTLRLNGQAVREAELHHADVVESGAVKIVFCAADAEPPLPALSLDFQLRAPQLTGLQKLTWFVTKLGRARHALVTAFEFPDDTRRVEKVERTVTALLRGPSRGNADLGQTIVDLLVFLCWHATRRGGLAKAANWLDLLARECPNATQRMALRWDLVKRLWQAADLKGFTKQAKALVSDKAAIPAKWTEVALDIAARAYVGVSAGCAREIISSANQEIKRLPQIQAMLALCECPTAYTSLGDAQKWMTRLMPETLGSCRVMRADALLALAAAAEWTRDWEKMIDWTIEALRAAPSHPLVLYWLCRARLRFPGGSPAEHIGRSWPEKKPEWTRLRLAVELHQNPGVKTAGPMTAVLETLQTKQDAPEQQLVIHLLTRALRGKEPVDTAEITAVARVCRAVQARAGALPWTDVHLARHEVLVERKYKDAYQRLERKELAEEPGAADWATVARILAGDALPTLVAISTEALQVLAAALDRVVGKPTQKEIGGAGQLVKLCGEKMLSRFPCLSGVLNTVALALQVLDGEVRTGDPALVACRPSDAAEAWVRWLYARTLLLVERGEMNARIKASPPLKQPYVAWAAECWIWNQRRSRTSLCEASAPITALLDGWVAASPVERRALAQIRRARLANYAPVDTPLPRAAPPSVFPELGERWDALSSADVSYELEYAASRRMIVEGDAKAAMRLLGELDRGLSRTAGIVAAWWRPLVRYWLGVAQARACQEAAAGTLQSLLDGPLDSDARGQLALLELGAGKTEQAEQWLREARADLPGVRYARALVFARRGAPELVREQIDSLAGRRVLEGSAYDVPARRLMAATLERLGLEKEAEDLRAGILAAQPLDEITIARHSRRKLKLAYEMARASDLDRACADSLTVILVPVQTVAWRRQHSVLREMLTGSGKLLRGLAGPIKDMAQDGLPLQSWRQILTRRLLCQGNPEAAMDVALSIDPGSAPDRIRRTQAILSAWHLLSRSWSSPGPDSDISKVLVECGEHLQQIGNGRTDEAVEFWLHLVRKGIKIAADPDGKESFRPWPEFDSHPFGKVPGLWAADPEVRKQSVEGLAADLELGDWRFREKQVLLLRALSAWARGADPAYLDSYGYLQPVLDELPVGGPQLWVASGLIHFSKRDWKMILESELPDCVADLANDDVRLLISLAYARSAAEDCVKGDMRNALQNVRRAQDNLGALLEA